MFPSLHLYSEDFFPNVSGVFTRAGFVPRVASTIKQTWFYYHEQLLQYRCHRHRLSVHSHVPQRTAPGRLLCQRRHRSRPYLQTYCFHQHPARMVRVPQGHGSLHLFPYPSRPFFHLPFHPRQGSGTLHSSGLFHSSPARASIRTGVLLVPHRP